MRYLIALLLGVHGVIHVLGFVQAWHLAPTPLTGRTIVPLSEFAARGAGLGWLGVAVILVGAAALRAFDAPAWWWVAAVGVVLSQALVILAWPEAKAGSLANILILVVVVFAAGEARFGRTVAREVRSLLSGVAEPGPAVTVEDLAGLPEPVRRWLEVSGVVGQPRARTVRLHQRGALRTTPDGPFMDADAEQHFRIDPPGFVWSVRAKLRGMPVLGRDRYAEGHGNMLITALGLVTMVDGRGARIDQGTALRFLSEMVWFPSGALSSRVRWDPVDDTHARATLNYGGQDVSGTFAFDDLGRVEGMAADRYMGGGADARLERWVVSVSAHRSFGGLEVPSAGSVTWKLSSGDFEYFRWEVTVLEVDPPEVPPPAAPVRPLVQHAALHGAR